MSTLSISPVIDLFSNAFQFVNVSLPNQCNSPALKTGFSKDEIHFGYIRCAMLRYGKPWTVAFHLSELGWAMFNLHCLLGPWDWMIENDAEIVILMRVLLKMFIYTLLNLEKIIAIVRKKEIVVSRFLLNIVCWELL